MRQALNELIERLLSGDPLTTDQLLWGGLIVCLVFASVHLFTMLVTRWGDRNTESKSLIFSVLVHLSCSLGVVAFHPPLQSPAEAKPERRIQIRNLFVEGVEKVETEQTGNTPVWEKLQDPIEKQLTRLDHLPAELKPLESPERRPEPVTQPEVDLPDLPSLPDEPVAMPKPQRWGVKGLRAEAAISLKIDDPTAEARPEVEVPRTANIRKRVLRRGQINANITREPTRGSVDRITRELDRSRSLASIDASPDPNSFLKRGPPENVIRRRVGPAPTLVPVDDPGTAAAKPTKGTRGGSPAPPQFARRSVRTPHGRSGGAIERFRPDRTPRTPLRRTGPALAVRHGSLVEVPRSGPRPNVRRPNFDAVGNRKSSSIPATYRLRSLARRKEFARKFGGTDASERAVEASLRWLAAHQSAEGFWDASRYGAGQVTNERLSDGTILDRKRAGIHADTGLTALSVLAFLGAGYTHEEGPYAERIDRALRWLIGRQRRDGYLGGHATHYAKMYCHGMATYALAEACGIQSDPTIDTGLRQPLRRAILYVLDQQNPKDGGWRYLKGQESDMSMFGWQLMALKSGEIAGIPIPRDAKRKLIQFLKDRSYGNSGGLANYRRGEAVSTSMTAEALFCKQMLGIERTNPASIEAVEYLMEHMPRRSELNLYYWYYGTLSVFQYGGDPWRKWNERLRDLLVAEQRTSGEHTGSWNPVGPWGPYGGRVYSTALSTLCLEVYYRYLPLYQMGGRYDVE